MGQLNVNPERVDQLIKRMNQHTIDIQQKQKAMKSFLTQMQSFWNDVHYQTFVQQFDEFDRMMIKAIHMSEITLLPHLKNVKRLAEDYKNLGKSNQ